MRIWGLSGGWKRALVWGGDTGGKDVSPPQVFTGSPLHNWAWSVLLGRGCWGKGRREKLKIGEQIKLEWLVGGKEEGRSYGSFQEHKRGTSGGERNKRALHVFAGSPAVYS